MNFLDRLRHLPLKSLFLLVGLLTLIVLSPLADEELKNDVFWRMLYLVVFCVGGYLLFEAKQWIIYYVAIAAPAFVLGVLKQNSENPPMILDISASLFTAILQILLITVVIRFSLYHPVASKVDRVVAGICGYLILGLFWLDIYQMVSVYFDDGFRSPAHPDGGPLEDDGSALYFSFVTLTTLGYGDISPANPWTRMLATVQAISGTLYIAVLISSLINRRVDLNED